MKKRTLIAGIGNIFFGDDAFGVEVIRELSQRSVPEGVSVKDFGIRGYDLAFALSDGFDAVVLVDAVSRGEKPGTVFLIEPDLDEMDALTAGESDAHCLNPVNVLRMAQSFGGIPQQIYLVGCEPCRLETEEGELGLSEPVRSAIPECLALIESLIQEIQATDGKRLAGLSPA